jgi:hypothetical protein
MRNISMPVLLYFLFSVIGIHSSSAQTVKNIFDAETPITYLGIDFTRAKVIGETNTDPTDIRDRQFPAINNIVINQPRQYDIAGTLQRQSITSDLGQVNTRNQSILVQQIKSSNVSDFAHLTATDIDKLVSSYDFAGKPGIGLLFVVDGMSYAEKASTVYITFINMVSKRVLLTERLEGKASGFGFRNYWAKTIEEVLKKIRNSKYNEWKKKYA